MTVDPVFISIIIPVYNDAARLRRCLAALNHQTMPKAQYEIIVVDNNSTDDIAAAAQAYEQIVLTHESQPGSYAARNRGISMAKGDVLAFTDSDCIPAKDWLEMGLAHLRVEPNCGFVAGGIKLFFAHPGRPNPIELYDSLFNLQQKKYLEEQGWGATANLFAYKSMFDRVGLFNDSLQSGGDAEWGKRVSTEGYRVFYAEEAYILHPARSSFREFCQKNRRTLTGAYRLSQTSQCDRVLQSFTFNDSLLKQLRPPLRSAFRKSYGDNRLKRTGQKMTVFWLVIFFHYLRAFEILRLKAVGLSASPS